MPAAAAAAAVAMVVVVEAEARKFAGVLVAAMAKERRQKAEQWPGLQSTYSFLLVIWRAKSC